MRPVSLFTDPFGIGWDEGTLGTVKSNAMTLGEKATLVISAYVWSKNLFNPPDAIPLLTFSTSATMDTALGKSLILAPQSGSNQLHPMTHSRIRPSGPDPGPNTAIRVLHTDQSIPESKKLRYFNRYSRQPYSGADCLVYNLLRLVRAGSLRAIVRTKADQTPL
jgi:hypothetical protein